MPTTATPLLTGSADDRRAREFLAGLEGKFATTISARQDAPERRRPPQGPAVPHQEAFATVWNTASGLWRSGDEAIRDNPEAARAMARDPQLRAWLNERAQPSTSLQLQIHPDDSKDPVQRAAARRYERLIGRIPNLRKLKKYLVTGGVFLGRYGAQIEWGRVMVDGRPATGIIKHSPWHGDKINFGWDGAPAVLVRTTFNPGLDAADLRSSDRGGGRYLMLDRPTWRDRFVIHEFEPEDKDFLFEADLAGAIHGQGLRATLFWPWTIKQQVLQWKMDAAQRLGSSGLLYAFVESGNPAARDAALEALATLARENIVVFERAGGIEESGIQSIAPTSVAYDVLDRFVEYLDAQMRLLIVGQSLSSDTAPMGIGGGKVAEAHEATKESLVRADAIDLAETFTTDVLGALIRYNEPGGTLPFGLRCSFLLDREDASAILDVAQRAQAIGLDLDEEDIREKSGLKAPESPDKALRAPGTQVAMPGGPAPAAASSPGSPKDATPSQAALEAETAPNPTPNPKPAPATVAYAKGRDRGGDPGVMVALFPPNDVAQALAIEGGEPAADLHVTLCYLGRRSEVGADRLDRLRTIVGSVARANDSLTGWIGGLGRFPASVSSDGLGVLYAGVDVPGLAELRRALVGDLGAAGLEYRKDHGFTPHLTLDYVRPDAPLSLGGLESRSASFDALWLCVGDDRERYPFGIGPGKVRYAAEHAPAGGVTVGGTRYPGGEFIPADVVASATSAEKAAIKGGKPGLFGRLLGSRRDAPAATPPAPPPALPDPSKPTLPPPPANPASPPDLAPADNPIRFTSARKANHWGMRSYHDWTRGLTKGERKATAYYAADGYRYLNEFYRGRAEKLEPLAEKLGPYLDRALAKARTPSPVVTWRGIADVAALGVNTIADLEGREFSDAGYGSTSLDPAKIGDFGAGDPRGIACEIRVPSGYPAAYLDDEEDLGESELLLARGARYRVLEIKPNGHGGGGLVLELLPHVQA